MFIAKENILLKLRFRLSLFVSWKPFIHSDHTIYVNNERREHKKTFNVRKASVNKNPPLLRAWDKKTSHTLFIINF